MQLTPEQKSTISEWASRGDSLSDIQKQIQSEFGINMTYMDVRLLVLDLDVSIKDKDQPKSTDDKTDAVSGDGLEPDGGLDEPAGDGSVSVELDSVVVPGAIVSGSVVFSDGVKATWALDQMGRLSLGASDPGYQPSPGDVELFQKQLQKMLQQKGF